MSARAVAVVEMLCAMAAGALVTVLAKLVLRDVPAFTFVWLQIAIGGSLLTLYTFGLRGERIPAGLGAPVWGRIVVIGVCNYGLVRVALLLSLERLPATTHGYLLSFVGVATMLLSAALLRERPSPAQVLGAALALGGLRIFFREVPAPEELSGVVFVGLAVLGLALYNNVARQLAVRTRGELSNNVVATVALWIGGVPLVVAGLALDAPPPVPGVRDWAVIALNGAVSVAFVMTLFNRLLRTLRSYEASLLANTGIIFLALFAVPILGERLAWHQVAGIVTMLVGLALVPLRPGSPGDADAGRPR